MDDSVQSRMVLATMSADRLFNTALISVHLFGLISDFFDFLRNHEMDEDDMSENDMSGDDMSDDDMPEEGPTDSDTEFEIVPRHSNVSACIASSPMGFDDLPPEIGLQVVRDLVLADRTRLAQTCNNSADVVAQALQDEAAKILSHFGLRFGHIRLMLTATGSVVAGPVVAALARVGTSFQPPDLTFVAIRGRGGVVLDFLHMAGGYQPVRRAGEYISGLGKLWSAVNVVGTKINVIESLTNSPFDVIGQFHLSCVYGAWTANGLLHGYPQLTAAGHTIATPVKLPLTSHSHRASNWDVLHLYIDRGFAIDLNTYDADHVCGVDPNCPATLRTTDDSGCSFSFFPRWIYDDEVEEVPPTCWTLSGTGCVRGILDGRSCATARLGQHGLFRMAPSLTIRQTMVGHLKCWT
ncbi:hypothetical protein C8R47DRAFT_1069594 [Mycena vitilis]|nr:hypothetical protein C8R47DRAFT_1069594 [Mycena vitilis]